MAQRSLHAFTKVNSISYVLLFHMFPLVGYHSIPSGSFHNCYGFPLLGIIVYPQAPLAPCGLVGIAIPVPCFRQDKLTRAFLISQQAIPYRTRGGTCCPGVSTPKTRSSADLSMTNHITWRIPIVSTIPTLLKPQHRSSPGSNHISTDGRPPLTNTHAKLNITKDGKTCMTLMTAWLSITTQHNPNPKVWGLGTVLKHAGQCVY
jgi:hypothetical protein